MPDTILPQTGATAILVGGSENTWGEKSNANYVIFDDLYSATTGHDHSAAGKGKPIPSGGLKSLTTASEGIVRAVGDGTFALATAGAGIAITAGAISTTALVNLFLPYQNKGAAGGTVTFDASLYASFSWTPNATSTIAISNATSGKTVNFAILVTNGGAFTVNYPGGISWPGGVVPSLSVSGTDILYFLTVDGGATWRAIAEIAFA